MKIRLFFCFVAFVSFLVSPAFSHTLVYVTSMSGPAEAPPNDSPGIGTARVTFDMDLVTMRVEAEFSGLDGVVTVAHIHCCTTDPGEGTIGVATHLPTFPGFPEGVSAGVYDQTFDMTDAANYNPAFVTNNGGTVSSALNAFLAGFDEGRAYFNIHSNLHPPGEIRGFMVLVPEPSSAMMLMLGAGGFLLRRRRG